MPIVLPLEWNFNPLYTRLVTLPFLDKWIDGLNAAGQFYLPIQTIFVHFPKNIELLDQTN